MTQQEHEKNETEASNGSVQEDVSSGHESIFNQTSTETKNAAEDVAVEIDPVEKLQTELQEAKDSWLRSEAENQNLRNRHKKELEDTRLYAVQKFARDVVEAAENLRRGIDSLPPKSEDEDPILTKMREGFESTERSFLQVLEKNGIKYEDPTGAAFDANKHQAMAEQPSDEHPAGTVIQSWTPTWTLNNRLLKPAMVIVSKAGEKKE
ncbi:MULTISPECIES: nucleotide exchange factor GrpE [Commensalibacter]|uniref:Protein GrpE n=2 Tax=Commensalibacter TaxID=1079922 RepID=W7DZ30_9PROT|nr:MULTISPECIES: nucleotide exchange factor GrpE [Commensalibacter]EUK17959.1 heat shock protein GrpE [Commensalibacter papalotli (ex Servin-Garciduenas et al. 2014)]CAI3941102.1 Molecular chaperone GrpE (heat shock protein HSP-70) (GrpE) (PDB:1DKG) [Commensalibacter papalotli (ex Botero et al. 2024)]CAI3949902.1 Molecular chaperone GrpE (heat shock protein HSP-70) (GrpE) (PDB:1DKG) [Commensalibacter papalotli (ex Botero et al. 2024)]